MKQIDAHALAMTCSGATDSPPTGSLPREQQDIGTFCTLLSIVNATCWHGNGSSEHSLSLIFVINFAFPTPNILILF